MPLYEYECGSCGARFERIRKFSDPPLEVCPTCGGSLRKLVSSPAFQFKGSGWYATDYQKRTAGTVAGDPAAQAEAGKDGAAKDAPAADASSASTSTESTATDTSSKSAQETKESSSKDSIKKESAKESAPPPASPSTAKKT